MLSFLAEAYGDAQSKAEHHFRLAFVVLLMVLGHECGIYILSQEIFRGFGIAIMYVIEYCVSMSSHPICEDLQSRCYFPHFIDQEPEPQGGCNQ